MVYRGSAREIFFDYDTSHLMRGSSGGKNFSYGSVLKQGFLNPENTYWTDDEYQGRSFEKWKEDWKKRVRAEGLSDETAEKVWSQYHRIMRDVLGSDQDLSEEKLSNRLEEEERRVGSYLSSLNISASMDKLLPEERMKAKKPGVFFGDWNVAKSYSMSEPSPLILEVRIPVSNVWVIVRPVDKSNPSAVERDIEVRNLREMKQRIGREGFRELCSKSYDRPGDEIVQYVWEGELSLEYVSGVYDPEITGEKVLEPLSEYLRKLKREEVLKMKEISFVESSAEEIENEIYILNSIENKLRQVLYHLEGIWRAYKGIGEARKNIISKAGDNWKSELKKSRRAFTPQLDSIRRGLLQIDKNLTGKIDPDADGYNEVVSSLTGFIEEETGRKPDLQKVDSLESINRKNMGKLIERVQEDVEEVEKMVRKERLEEKKLSFDRNKLSKEEHLQKKIDRIVEKRIAELPDMTGLERSVSADIERIDNGEVPKNILYSS